MKVIVTRRNSDGTYDEVGMNNRALFSQYRTIAGAMRYAAVPFSKGRRTRIEFFTDSGIYGEPFKTLYIN